MNPALLPLSRPQGTRPGARGRIQTLCPHCRAQGGLLVISNDWFSEQDTEGLKQTGQRSRPCGELHEKLDSGVWSRAPGLFTSVTARWDLPSKHRGTGQGPCLKISRLWLREARRPARVHTAHR